MALGPGGRDQHALFAQAVHDPRGPRRIWRAFGHDVLAQKQPLGPQFAQGGVARGQITQPRSKGRAHAGRVLDQALAFDHIQHRIADRRGHRIAAEGVEIPRLGPEARDHLRAQGEAREGIAIAHRLAHADHIRHHAMAGKAPHAMAQAAKTGLHLIGDEEPACGTNCRHGRGQHCRIDDHPIGRKHRISDQHRRLDAVALQVINRRLHISPEIAPHRRGHHPHMRPQRHARPERGRKLGHCRRHAVIGVFGHDDAGAARCRAGNADREVIGL